MNVLKLVAALKAVQSLPAGAITPAGASKEADGCLLLQLRISPAALALAGELLPELGVDLPLEDLLLGTGSPSTPEDGPKA